MHFCSMGCAAPNRFLGARDLFWVRYLLAFISLLLGKSQQPHHINSELQGFISLAQIHIDSFRQIRLGKGFRIQHGLVPTDALLLPGPKPLSTIKCPQP